MIRCEKELKRDLCVAVGFPVVLEQKPVWIELGPPEKGEKG